MGIVFDQSFNTTDNVHSDSHPSNVITPYSDIVNFSLFLNKNTYFNLEIQTELQHILSINRQVENSLNINR